ncbi:hypothetical protein DITRI_Ditri03aG0196800 [Diplodiscus trichospermus]
MSSTRNPTMGSRSSFNKFSKSQNFQQTSGSGWFETLFNSHINVSSNGEVLGLKDRRSNMETMDRVYNLDWFTSASKNECSAAVGFKWMHNRSINNKTDSSNV